MGCGASIEDHIPMGTVVMVVGGEKYNGRVGTVIKEGKSKTTMICYDRLDVDEEVINVSTNVLVAQSRAGGDPEEKPEEAPEPEPEAAPTRKVKKQTEVITAEKRHKTRKKVLQSGGSLRGSKAAKTRAGAAKPGAGSHRGGGKDAAGKYRISAGRKTAINVEKISAPENLGQRKGVSKSAHAR